MCSPASRSFTYVCLPVLSYCNLSWITQIEELIAPVVVHVIWIIWLARNKVRFDNYSLHFRKATSLILAIVQFSGRLSSDSSYSSLYETQFWINLRFLLNSARILKLLRSCGTTWWEFRADNLGCFAFVIGIDSSLIA